MKSRKNLRRKFFKHLKENLFVYLMAGLAVSYASPLYAAPAPNALPSGGQFVGGSGSITPQGLQMDVVQHQQNAAIKWQQFNVGKDASVNFKSNAGGPFNTLNYVNGGNVSEIYGKINAQNGNIYLVNPAGVQIGDGAKVNVGSLYVSNKKLDESKLASFNGNNIDSMVAAGQTANAQLMSLGDIVSAGKVTFDGDRIVIDADKLYKNADHEQLVTAQNLVVKTSDMNNVVIGYAMTKGRSANQSTALAEGSTARDAVSYEWIENLDQLQAMKNKLNGNFALKKDIDASATKNRDYGEKDGKGFKPVGQAKKDSYGSIIDGSSTPFTGRFEGNDFEIKNLYINRPEEDSVGLFGYTKGATIGDVTIGKGSSIKGKDSTGAIIGLGENTTIGNLTNYANVEGRHGVGGIIGDLENKSTINKATLENYGEVKALTWSEGLDQDTGDNIGGIIGNCLDVTITDSKFYNEGKVSGQFSVGGIFGTSWADISGSYFANGEASGLKGGAEIESSGGEGVGGIIGKQTTGNIESSTFLNFGSIGGSTYIHRMGGIFGSLENKNKLLKDCFFMNRGTITNTGSGAWRTAGIIGDNARNVEGSTLINSGAIKVKGGGGIAASMVGGIFGTNDGKIENSTLTNTADIAAKDANYVGGLIGINRNKIQNSTLVNFKKVEGKENVGGLIGQNHSQSGGDWIYGGRDEKDEYYKYMICNIGAVEGEKNVGGIIGENKGTLSGAFNVGTVTGTGEAVGGIVGNNQYNIASVEEVFNMGDVKGKDKVGGIIGANPAGALSDAYNTANVTGTSNVGNVLGYSESSSNKFERIYATNTTGKLIGAQKYKAKITDAYSFVPGDTSIEGVTVIDSTDKQKLSESYGAMLQSGKWKIYEGQSTPLLKFFLTKATYNGDTMLNYTGENQGLNVDNVTAPDPNQEGASGKVDSNLLHAIQNSAVGDNYLAFWSDQVYMQTVEGETVPVMGYDIDTTYSIYSGTRPQPPTPSGPDQPNPPTPPTPELEQQEVQLEVYDLYDIPHIDTNLRHEQQTVPVVEIENGGMELDVEEIGIEVE